MTTDTDKKAFAWRVGSVPLQPSWKRLVKLRRKQRKESGNGKETSKLVTQNRASGGEDRDPGLGET